MIQAVRDLANQSLTLSIIKSTNHPILQSFIRSTILSFLGEIRRRKSALQGAGLFHHRFGRSGVDRDLFNRNGRLPDDAVFPVAG